MIFCQVRPGRFPVLCKDRWSIRPVMSYLSLAVKLHHLPGQDVPDAGVEPDQVPLAELRYHHELWLNLKLKLSLGYCQHFNISYFI